MKKSDVRSALRRMATKLDNQWAYAQQIVAEQVAAGTLARDADGDPLPNNAQICYSGMVSAFEAMGGEWQRNEAGKHWVYFLGESSAGER